MFDEILASCQVSCDQWRKLVRSVLGIWKSELLGREVTFPSVRRLRTELSPWTSEETVWLSVRRVLKVQHRNDCASLITVMNRNVKLSLCLTNSALRHEPYGGRIYRSTLSWPRNQLEMCDQLHAPVALPPGKQPPVPIG
jgi:ligand-binding sensor domain-containing protein